MHAININCPSPPKHVAIIMDGNRRWAKANGLSIIDGHKAGINTAKNIASSCIKFGVRFLTLYAFSFEKVK